MDDNEDKQSQISMNNNENKYIDPECYNDDLEEV